MAQIHDVAPRTDDAMARADWRRVVALYKQFSEIVSDPCEKNEPNDDLVSGLAESISRTFAHYDGSEHQFMRDVFDVLREAEMQRDPENWDVGEYDQFHWLYSDNRLARIDAYRYPNHSQQRRPTPLEAAIETTRRIIDINRIGDELSELSTAAVLGGSLSYGRFFNTRGKKERPNESDVDLILVLPGYDVLSDVAERLDRVPGVVKASLKELKQRLRIFESVRANRPGCIFGHKLRMWERTPAPFLSDFNILGDYLLKLHVFSQDAFDLLIMKDVPILSEDEKDPYVRELFEYRDDRSKSRQTLRSFNGTETTIDIEQTEVEGGFVAAVRICFMDCADHRFYPGTHLNMILPRFEVRWESPTVRLRLALLALRWKLLERLAEERRLRIFEHQTLSLSHTRTAVFAPHVRRGIDRESRAL
jgi:hypothetical protein